MRARSSKTATFWPRAKSWALWMAMAAWLPRALITRTWSSSNTPLRMLTTPRTPKLSPPTFNGTSSTAWMPDSR